MARVLTVRVLRPIIVGDRKHEVGEVVEIPYIYQCATENIHANPRQEGGPRVEIVSVTGVDVPQEDLSDVPAVTIDANGNAHLVKNPHPPQKIEIDTSRHAERLPTIVSRPACDGEGRSG